MICGHCGHLNEDETRCLRCGRRLDEPRHRSGPGESRDRRAARAHTAPWRQELHRRLDAYRQRRDAGARAANADSTETSPNVISIERGAGFPNPAPADDRIDSVPTATWLDQRAAEIASNGGTPITPDALSLSTAAASEQAAQPFLPLLGMEMPPRTEAVAVETLVKPRPKTANEVRCSATVAPLQIRFMAAVLDATVLLIALGTFWGVFHQLGGAISADREGARAVGVTAFFVVGFYWTFHVGYFGGTPGMVWLGLRLLNFHGRRANGSQRAARALGLLFSTATFGIGFAWALLDDEKLTWHDRMSKTFISRDPATGFRARAGLVETHPRPPSSRKHGA